MERISKSAREWAQFQERLSAHIFIKASSVGDDFDARQLNFGALTIQKGRKAYMLDTTIVRSRRDDDNFWCAAVFLTDISENQALFEGVCPMNLRVASAIDNTGRFPTKYSLLVESDDAVMFEVARAEILVKGHGLSPLEIEY